MNRLPGIQLAGAVIVGASASLSGCSSLPDVSDSVARQAEVLDGTVLFGEPVSAAEVPDSNVLEVNAAMRAFLDEQIGNNRIPAVRFRRMFGALEDNGYFESSYVADTTRTAAETFALKSGNCLSYTNMFVALAREAGLDAAFQIVKVPPTWDADSGYLIRYTHINVIIKGFVFDTRYGEDFSVDFNDVLPDPDYQKYEISDAEAIALFYANRSVSLMRAGDTRSAFAHLKKAIELDATNPNLWINLGAFYSKQDRFEQAVLAYELALHYDFDNRGAISGLSRAHYLLGNFEEADVYADKVRRYRKRNPFYHYAIAQAEFENAEYDEALVAINIALNLKYRNGRFHFLKGLTEHKMGEIEAAEASFRRAARYGNYRDLKRRYLREVADAQPLG